MEIVIILSNILMNLCIVSNFQAPIFQSSSPDYFEFFISLDNPHLDSPHCLNIVHKKDGKDRIHLHDANNYTFITVSPNKVILFLKIYRLIRNRVCVKLNILQIFHGLMIIAIVLYGLFM
jgi:hypothetical protein